MRYLVLLKKNQASHFMREFATIFAILLVGSISAQLNVSYVGNIGYDQDLSDIWGYASPDGTEYAIVGVFDGVSIVSLEDPSNPTELFFFPGAGSTWRDIKTFAGYAYVTNETDNGLMVIDLNGLPAAASAVDWAPNIPGLGTLSSIHNIWIDEFGYAYLPGSNLNSGGVLYVDVFTTPGEPIYVDKGPAIYSHDVFTRNNIMYSSEIYAGVFSIYDISDKNNSQVLGSSPTEGAFTHNAWLSDDNTILYTTDEQPDSPVGSYNVSDPTDVQELDQFRPFETLGDGVIPHNVHVWEDWLIVSYYTDGCIILDGSNPTNLVEVGNFDTFIPPSAGFSGAWGAYPYLPSGLILISDIGNGMYVLQPNYVNACWLEGVITDAATGNGISGADITILNTNIFDESQAQGVYATGYAVSGTYDILVEKAGYISQTLTVELDNGVITELDVALVALSSFSISGSVIDETTSSGIAGVEVILENDEFSYNLVADGNGSFSLTGMFAGTFSVSAGLWGYITDCVVLDLNEVNNTIEITLQEGYYDDFTFDFGWSTSSTASSGNWERAVPIGTSFGNEESNPGEDVQGDCSNQAYVTGNGGGQAGNDDVDDGEVTLISPSFLLNGTEDATLSYYRWFLNDGGSGDPNDQLEVHLINGSDEYLLETLDASDNLNYWEEVQHDLSGLGLNSGLYSVRFKTADGNSGHLVEAAVDQFSLITTATGMEDVELVQSIIISPNPSMDNFTIDYALHDVGGQLEIVVMDELSRIVEERVISNLDGQVKIGANYDAGIYFLHFRAGENYTEGKKLVKF